MGLPQTMTLEGQENAPAQQVNAMKRHAVEALPTPSTKSAHKADGESVLHTGFDGKKHEYCPYNETSKTYDQTRAPLGVNVFLGSLALGDSAPPLAEQRVLDIGCGTGTFMCAIEGKVGELSGMDYSEGMLSQAKANLRGNAPLCQGSADSLPFESASFDACSMNQVVHHFPKADDYSFLIKSFEEAFRVLKPGGVFHINTSAPEQQRDGFWWLSLFPEASEKMMARFPPIARIKKCLTLVGFEVNADSVVVPVERTLMAESVYLAKGLSSAFDASYRNGDSSWSMAENTNELEAGLQKLQEMQKAGTAAAWLAERETLRKKTGQATFVTVRKPLQAEFSASSPLTPPEC